MTEKEKPNCGKCGLCLMVCPVYKEMKEEHASPRARMQLIKAHDEKTLNSSPFLKEIISKCLMCGSCTAACPSGINHYEAFMKMREKMAKDHGESIAIKSLIYLLSRDRRTRTGSKLARTGQSLMPESLSERLNIGNIPLRHFPKLNSKPFRKACGSVILPDKKPLSTVAYFTGCATQYLFDDTGFAAVGILKHLGYKVIIPQDQTCCAIPLLFHGAAQQAKENIATNIRALTGLDADHILVDCSTCGEALKKIYPAFAEENGLSAEEARAISEKTVDILSFIEDRLDRLHFKSGGEKKQIVTYHAPCHSKNSEWHHAQSLIEKLPFLEYRKTEDTEECCGGGGTFFYEYPEVSRKMIDKKIKNAKAVQAKHWLTDCPVCRMNLSGNLKKDGSMIVSHPLTLINAALRQNED